jgi:hypothetical protein
MYLPRTTQLTAAITSSPAKQRGGLAESSLSLWLVR